MHDDDAVTDNSLKHRTKPQWVDALERQWYCSDSARDWRPGPRGANGDPSKADATADRRVRIGVLEVGDIIVPSVRSSGETSLSAASASSCGSNAVAPSGRSLRPSGSDP